jgi:hypothetical protein
VQLRGRAMASGSAAACDNNDHNGGGGGGGGGGGDDDDDDDDSTVAGDDLFDESFLLESLLEASGLLGELQQRKRTDEDAAADTSAHAIAVRLATVFDTLWQISALGDASSNYLVRHGVVDLAYQMATAANRQCALEQDAGATGRETLSAPASVVDAAMFQCLQLSHGMIANLVVVCAECRGVVIRLVPPLHDSPSRPVHEAVEACRAVLSSQGFRTLLALFQTLQLCPDVDALAQVGSWAGVRTSSRLLARVQLTGGPSYCTRVQLQ